MARNVRRVGSRFSLGLAVGLAGSVATAGTVVAQDVTCAAPTLPMPVVVPGGDASGAGAQPGPVPESPQACWTWSIDPLTMNADENEIVAVGDVVVTTAHDPTVIALDATAGSERWQYQVSNPDYGQVSGLAAVDDVVYAGGTDGLTALAAADGSLLWEYVVDNPDSQNPQWGGFFSPIAIGGSVYGTTRVDDAAGLSSFVLVALDAATGAERWTVPISTEFAGVAASDGTLVAVEFYTLVDDLRWPNLGVFDAATGESRWVREITDIEQWPSTRPVVTQDLVYLGAENGDIVALAAADGSREWRADIGTGVKAMTVTDGTLYATGSDSVLHALNARNGKERWDATPKVGRISPFAIPAAVQDGPVVVGAAEDEGPGFLYAYDPKTGKQAWRVETEPSGRGFMAPIVVGGRVIVGMHDMSGSWVVSYGAP